MSEEAVKTIRLNKAAKEFNVGIAKLVEFLSKKGFSVENNPNAKITSGMYDLLAGEFQAERNVKEQAQKINISATKDSVVIEASRIETPEPEPEMPEIVIKNYSNVPPTVTKPKQEEEAAKGKVEIEEQNVATEAVETPAQAEQEEKPKAKTAEKEKTTEEPIAEKEEPEEIKEKQEDIQPEPKIETEKPEEEKQASSSGIKIVDKIDLSAINSKSRPAKKGKEEKIKEREEAKERLAVEKAKSKATASSKETASTEKETEIVSESAVEEVIIEVSEEKHIEKEEVKRDNFIETQYQKLDGPTIVSKIDLSQFQKPKKQPVASSSAKPDDLDKKKKRKRIKKEVVGTPTTTDNKSTDNKSTDNKQQPTKDKKGGKGKKDFQKKVEVDSVEIEKQIRETLARLNPMGKSKTSKYRREKRQTVNQQIHEEQIRAEESRKILKVTEFVTANELATMMDISVNEIISTCMSVGMFISINQRLDAEAIQLIADEFGFKLDFVSADVVEAIHDVEEEDKPEDMILRAPIVTVMGHVDHGKTSLLDYVRKANVIAGEAGGITQHIGAYEVSMPDSKKITFLDTPGHEAFTAMRARGAKITDIVIIVIAADDRIMPQTVEAINHAQAAGVPLVFAINKIDKPGANPEKIKEELAAMNLLVEEWGGKYQSQDISAKKGIHVEELLEKVLLEAELLELKGNPKKRAKGTIIESALDKGRGYVSKILVQDGTIRIGDMVLAGSMYGRVKAMYNERNIALKEAGPSTPILLLGLNGAPQAGDTFNVMASEKEAKDIASRRQQLQREQGIRTQKHITLEEIGRRIAIGDFKQLNLIVKGDVDGSVEALSDSLLKLSKDEVQVNVIHKSVGPITESDVSLATASNAIIIGFQVRPSLAARKLAEAEEIDIRLYSIIYNAINEIKSAIEGMLSPEIQEKIICNLEIREVFKITKVGTIAGCMCLDGKINRQTKVRIIREGIVVYTGKLASLKRFKDEVKEVVSGQDCGLNIENFNDIKVGDIVEGYEEIEIQRKF